MKLYLDTMIWVFFFEGPHGAGASASSFVHRVRSQQCEIFASHLSLAEILVLPNRTGNAFAASRYRAFFRSGTVRTRSFGFAEAERFAAIRAQSNVKQADAMHLAVAAAAGADYFVTYDQRLLQLKVPGIGAIVPPDRVP